MWYGGRTQEHKAQPLFCCFQNLPILLPKAQALQYGVPSPSSYFKVFIPTTHSAYSQKIFVIRSSKF